MARFEIRALLNGDEDELHRVAAHLNSVNLPNDRTRIEEIVAQSQNSFSGVITNKNEREYVFALIDCDKQRLIGTSMILAQLGRRGAPYIYYDVIEEERYSATIDRHFHHRVLRIGYSYNGPTEIGGLVVDPAYRTAPERLGSLISYVRFLYMAAHREAFREEVVAELLPPLEPDGTSHLWEALGRKFTDMSYAEADLLSKKNKEFIKGLFPEGVVYTSILPREAQDVVGKVGAQTRGVEKMLRRIGFRYADRVDPFDGGPHFFAAVDEIHPVRDTRRVEVEGRNGTMGGKRCLIALEYDGPPYFRATTCSATFANDRSKKETTIERVQIDADAAAHLGITEPREALLLPLP